MRSKINKLLLLCLFIGFISGAIVPKSAMAMEPFLGEIRIFSFGFAPKGWAPCNGQLLPTNQNQALFSLLGTTYGGNGQTTFALPDLRGRIAIHMGNGHTQGEKAGEEAHTLLPAEIPMDAHGFANSNPGTLNVPSTLNPAKNNILAGVQTMDRQDLKIYASANNSEMFSRAGGNQPHTNMQPYLVVNYCIALQGVFPSRN